MVQRRLQHAGEFVGRGRRSDREPGDHAKVGEVEGAVVRWSVRSGDAGAVDHEDNRQVVESDVRYELVERSLQER